TVSDGVESCSAALSGGEGSCVLALTTVGARTLTATYAGSTGFTGSSATAPHRVEAPPPPPPEATTTAITDDSPDPSEAGTSVTVSFTVIAAVGTPTGSVTVSDGVESCNAELSDGEGSCNLALTTPGDRTITATYPGSDGFSESSGTAPHTVEAAPEPTTTSVGSLGPLH
ncbi:MAG TPA: Ig-like domain-containing protein, partial [Gemmatimonadales bacterium]